jgi:hypothetical protein
MSSRADLLGDFASRYIWWRDETPPSEDRIIAQVMSIGTWEDIRRLEAAYSPDELRGVMLRAQPGWISEPSWNLWRGRLSVAGAGAIPETPPRRSFYDDAPCETPDRSEDMDNTSAVF